MKENEIRNVAVIVAGIDEEYQSSVIDGINASAKAHQINVSYFAAFGGVLGNSQYDIGEYNIYTLTNFSLFDGVILMTNTINDPSVRDEIFAKVRAAGIPAVIFDSDADPLICNIRIDNITAMRSVVQHIITAHNARVVNYVSGPLANPEAQARYDAFLSVMAENRLPVDVRRVYFGEFRPIDGKRAVETMLESGLPLPDALICANDAMALEALSTLEKHGVKVPEQVMVTGFDNTYYAQNHSPALTSVDRPLRAAGVTACDTLIKLMNGQNCGRSITLTAEPVWRESCGCKPEREIDIESYKKSTYDLIKRSRSGVSLLNRMTSSLAETETAEECFRVMGEFIGELECEQCSVCLCEDWQSAFRDRYTSETAEEYQIHGYTDKMTAPIIWKNGKITSLQSYPSRWMFPEPISGSGNISYFLPLHFRERCLGYYIITNSDFPTKSILCHSLMMNISHSFENIRKLLHLNNAIRELDRLYVIDPLCGIYNRNGFIRLADAMFRKCARTGENLLISFIDMDGLKYINDNFGHDEGDFALRRLASVISDSCFGDCICARFGGDEFIIIGTNSDTNDAERLESTLRKNLVEMNRIINKPYELAASIGSFVTQVTDDMKLFTLISQADQIMYEQKKKKRTSRYLRKD